MNCPTYNVVLQMTELQGIEIDYCPKARGVWLDRGELDRIIECLISERRSAVPENRRDDSHECHHEKHHHDDHGEYPHRKKRSFFENLFD
jgi:Zn-finger nucleic acid-binding protein